MSAAAAAGWRASARRIQLAKRSADGYPFGIVPDADSVANNTTTSAHVIRSLRTMVHPQKTVARAFEKGDNKVYGQMYIGVDDYGEGTFEVGVEDEIYDALNQQTAVDTAIATDMAVVADNASNVESPPWFIMAATRKQLDDGSFWYDNDIYCNAVVRKSTKPGISQAGGESPNPTVYSYAPSLSERLISGHTFAGSDLQVLEDEDTFVKIRSKHPLAVTTFKGNGTADTIQLPFLPVFSGATGAAQNIITVNGATVAVTSVNTSTGLVTLADAGDAADIFIVLYQTRFKKSA